MRIKKKALFCLALLAGSIIGTSFIGKGSSAYADWDDWGHRGGGYFRGPYQQGGWGGYRPINYGWGGRPGWGGGGNRGGWGGYGSYRPCGGWNRGGWGGGWRNQPWGGWNRGGWGNAWGGGPRWRRGGMW